MFDRATMKGIIFCLGAMLLSINQLCAKSLQQKFDKAAYYSVMKSGDLDAIDKELAMLYSVPAKERGGYEGAL